MRPTILAVTVVVLLLVGCSAEQRGLMPASNWPDGVSGSELHDVQIRQEYRFVHATGYGSGVVVHSSVERGTYILTNWHVACFPGWYFHDEENVEATGPVNISVSVNVHARSTARADWQEWKEFTGTVVYARYRDSVNLGVQKPGEQLDNSAGVWEKRRGLDIALLHVTTGAEPLNVAPLDPVLPDESPYGEIRGVSTDGIPRRDSVIIVNDGFFYGEAEFRSGSGVYRSGRALTGIFWGWMGLEQGSLTIGNERKRINKIYMMTPIELIRKELTEAGFGFIFDRVK